MALCSCLSILQLKCCALLLTLLLLRYVCVVVCAYSFGVSGWFVNKLTELSSTHLVD